MAEMNTSSAAALVDSVHALITDSDTAGISVKTAYRSVSETVTPPAGSLGEKLSAGAKPENIPGFFLLPESTEGNPVYGCSLDSWGSQANRMEQAIRSHAQEIGFPIISLYISEGSVGDSLSWSHRQSDATFRAALPIIDADPQGIPASQILAATPSKADELMRWFPHSLLFGWWNSNPAIGEKKAAGIPQVLNEDRRSARVISSEIIARGVALRTRYAGRVDQAFGPISDEKDSATNKSEMASYGFGSLPPQSAPKDVTFRSIEGATFLSLTRLRQLGFEENAVEVRAALVLLGLLAIQGANRDLHLRAGTDLIMESTSATIERHGEGSQSAELPSTDMLVEALRIALDRAGVEWKQTEPIDVSGSKMINTAWSKTAAAQKKAED